MARSQKVKLSWPIWRKVRTRGLRITSGVQAISERNQCCFVTVTVPGTSTNNIILIFFKGSVTKHVTTVPTTGSNILTVTKVPYQFSQIQFNLVFFRHLNNGACISVLVANRNV
jgi:hypothetical protein